MVGVPGRSKACHTCLQRRIACDLERPQCSQCLKSNRPCAGYQRERIFIDNNGYGCGVPWAFQRDASTKKRTKLSADRKKSLTITSSKNREYKIATTISPQHLHRQQLLSNFLIHYGLDKQSNLSLFDSREDRPAAWLRRLPELTARPKVLELSILAVCTAKFGRLNNDSSLVYESLKFYIQGLVEMQRAVNDRAIIYEDETLAACMMLSLYESVECPAKTRYGWKIHVTGCAKLIQLRGPKAHSSAFGHELFLSFRRREVLQAITQRRSTYLSAPEWIQEPWQTLSKSPFHQLLDIMVALPEIIKQGYRIRRFTDIQRLLSTLEIIECCLKIDMNLHQFFEEFEEKSLGPLYWPEFPKESNYVDDSILAKGFPVAFHFLNPRVAQICMLYWATLIILWSGLAYSYKRLSKLQPNLSKHYISRAANCCDNTVSQNSSKGNPCNCSDEVRIYRLAMTKINNLPPLEHRGEVVDLARNICQSLEYCLQSQLHEIGPGFAYFPMKVAVEAFGRDSNCSRELIWAKSALEKICRRGVRLYKYLSSPLTRKIFLLV